MTSRAKWLGGLGLAFFLGGPAGFYDKISFGTGPVRSALKRPSAR